MMQRPNENSPEREQINLSYEYTQALQGHTHTQVRTHIHIQALIPIRV